MASLSINKVVLPSTPFFSSSRRSNNKRGITVLRCVSQQAASAESVVNVAGKVDASRLEPRVEERDGGYWVLKEKFREKISPQEKIKIEKDPMKLFIEDGINDLAKLSMEDVDASKENKDDVDVRLKWLGLFHRRKNQCMFISRLDGFKD